MKTGGETLLTTHNGYTWLRFTDYTILTSLYIYFAQLRHNHSKYRLVYDNCMTTLFIEKDSLIFYTIDQVINAS